MSLLKNFLPYLRCLFPIMFVLLAGFAYVMTNRIIKAWLISRVIPPTGFASVEDEIRYVNDDPAETRRIWGYKAKFIYLGIFAVGGPLSYIIPAVVFK